METKAESKFMGLNSPKEPSVTGLEDVVGLPTILDTRLIKNSRITASTTGLHTRIS